MTLHRLVFMSLLGTFSCGAPSGGGGSVHVTVSGEASAIDGVSVQDGWEIQFTHVLTTFDRITLSENPDKNAADPSQTGDVVAQVDGPFAVDLAAGGPLDAKEMNGKAVSLTRITKLNKKADAALSTTEKYAFGFDTVAAASNATHVGLSADAKAAYQSMVAKGFTVLLQGTATFKGTSCRQTVAGYDFGRLPKVVKFSFGFKTPTSYKNCANPELSGADARGVQVKSNGETVAQITFHLDHPFWEALEEDAPLRWDAIAARKSVATGAGPASVEVTEADLMGLDYRDFKDAQGTALPWRYCGPMEATERVAGTVKYETGSVPYNASGGAAGLKDFYDYASYNLSTFGHMNNDGICYPARNYPSPH